MALQTARPLESVAVHSKHGEHKAYLEIVRDYAAIRVQPTPLGKKKLNRFWTMWLRKLLLDQAPTKRTYGIEIRSNSVRITSEASIEAMMGTVYQIAAQVQPLDPPPIARNRWEGAVAHEMRWGIKATPEPLPWEEIFARISLPRGVRLYTTLWDEPFRHGPIGYITITYPLKRNHTPSQLGKLLELEVALACHQ